MTFTKPDGVIELAASPCCCPPDKVKVPGTLHTRGFTFWYRIQFTGYGWAKWNIHCIASHAQDLAAKAESCTEFVELMTGATS